MSIQDSKLRRSWPIWCLSCVLIAGCHSLPPAQVIHHARLAESSNGIEIVSYQEPLPFLPRVVNEPKGPKAAKAIPISLDTVLRLAQDQNGQVRIARIKLESAATDQEWADKLWLPDLSIGMATYRHDGGIQDFQGNLIRSHYGSTLAGVELSGKYDWKELLFRRVEAERRVWQQRGELSKLTSENLLDAANTYIGLLAARSGVAVSLETELRLKDLLDQTTKLAKDVDPGLQVEVSRIDTELMAQTVLTVKLREASKGATARLAYLLGLNPCCEFILADGKLMPIALVDPNQPVHKLIDQSLARGPGVRELEGLLGAVEAARNANYGLVNWLPTMEMSLTDGSFGASPGGRTYEMSNRFDAMLKLRWSLTEWAASKQKRQQADMNIQQVQLSVHDLRAKLSLGVQEAHDAIHSGLEQVKLAEMHITKAEQSHKLSDQRLKEGVKGRSASEVMLALRTVGGARLEYLQAVRDLNRAQLRLFVLVGVSEAENLLPPTGRSDMRPERPKHHPPRP